MDEVTFVKTQFRKEQWKKLILECQSSGVKVEDWCASHNVTKNMPTITGFTRFVKKPVKICRLNRSRPSLSLSKS